MENGDGETQGSTEDGKEEDEAQRKQEDIACLRSKIQTVMEILCSTPLGKTLTNPNIRQPLSWDT